MGDTTSTPGSISENKRRKSVASATKVEHLREDFGLTSETTDDETVEGQIT